MWEIGRGGGEVWEKIVGEVGMRKEVDEGQGMGVEVCRRKAGCGREGRRGREAGSGRGREKAGEGDERLLVGGKGVGGEKPKGWEGKWRKEGG